MEKRSHYWDNVKTFLIFLVVLGHYLLVIQKKTVLVEAVYWWIYSFHMPAFIFVSGYFAKSFAKKRGDGNKLLGFLILYVVYVLLLWCGNMLQSKQLQFPSFFSTGSAQWYLLAMFFWYLLLLFVSEFPGRFTIPISFLVGILVGFDHNAGSFLAMSRILVFFPFFLLGYYFNKSEGEKQKQIPGWIRVLGTVFLIAAFMVLLYKKDMLSLLLRCAYGDKSYAAMGMTRAEGVVWRSLWYLAAVGMTAAFLCVISPKKQWFTYIGAYTLPVYIIHRVLRDVFVWLGLYSVIGNGAGALIVCTVLSLLVIAVCANKTLGKLFQSAFTCGSVIKQKIKK